MDSERHRKLSEVFEDALDRPVEDRRRFIAESCAGDLALQQEVERLLDALPEAEALFQSTANDRDLIARTIGEQEIGRQIGEFRLVRVIAAGGMGTVYLAERVDPELRMRVAIKIVRPGLATADILRRFVTERQLLAELSHPNIARLIGGGATEDGLPYLVMEYIDGVPLDHYCSANRVDVEGRIALMRTICSAVHYAHRNLVVHRDLKPSNVLVTAEGEVKLLDFGIAKVLEPRSPVSWADDRTLTALRPLTPRYASPEQIRGDRITTASDIYSLGIILYQILTGATPYDSDGRSPVEVERIVCHGEIEPPSAVVRARQAPVLGAPPLEPKRLAQRLAGDLDTIVLKALRKEPDRRYASVEELSADLHRYIQGLPVSARPDTLIYRLVKFGRRNRFLVIAGCAILLLLVSSVAVSLVLATGVALLVLGSAALSFVLYRRADHARRLAEERTVEAEWLAYTSCIAAAEGAILGNQIDDARIELEKAPARLRGWEWRHLWGRLDRADAVVDKHRAIVTALDYSPDGRLIASSSKDQRVIVWDAITGETRQVFEHAAWVESSVFSSDGHTVASAARDHSLAAWDVATGKQLAEVKLAAIPRVLDVSPDGLLAAGLQDGTIQVRTLPSLVKVAEWKAQDSGVSCLAFNPPGTVLAVGSWDGALTLWSHPEWRLLRTIQAHGGRVTNLDWSSDGRLASGSADTKVKIWNAETGKEIASVHRLEGMIGTVLFNPDGGRILAGDSDGHLLTFDSTTGERAALLRVGPGHATYRAARSPNGEHMATGTVSGAVLLWRWDADDVRWLIPKATAPEMNFILNAVPSPDGSLVASASRSSGIDLWDARNGRLIHHVTVEGAGGASCAAFSPDGTRLYAAHGSGIISVTEVAARRLAAVFAAHTAVLDSPPHMDGALIITALAVHPGGALIASAALDHTVKIWDALGRLVRVLGGHEGEVTDAEFSPDGKLLATSSDDSAIKLWEVESGSEIKNLRAHLNRVQDIAFSPDGRYLVSASNDRTVRLWDVGTGTPIATLHRSPSAVMTATAFSGDGTRIAAGGMDKVIRIFDPIRKREVARLHGHMGRIKSLRFGPADRLLVSASIDGTVGIWDAAVPRVKRG